jgi:hypothetical protein
MARLTKEDIPLALAVYFTYLKDHGVTYIKAEFNGGGDSGGVEDYFTCHHSQIDDDWHEKPFADSHAPDDMPIIDGEHESLIEDIVLRHSKNYDWWNNDGGYGQFIMNIHTLEYRTEYNIYETRVDSYSDEGYVDI